ncbi:ATP-binding protein [Methanobrevibacter sp.]|uniref:ATP-binding protein n=1 Tax=Methanobrevibacter sp. TaxID=66852 RepID=UPI00386BA498
MKKLNEYIQYLNTIITKIKNNECVELTLNTILPLLFFMKNRAIINNEEFDMLLNKNILKIKELKYYKFNDFHNISDEIEEYLSEFIEESIELLPRDMDYQSVYFLLYEILINVYKHSKFHNAYLQIIIHNKENIDICIFDNGIGIPGSFKEASMESDNDCEAIYDAINGKTTDKEKFVIHGMGLNTTSRLTTLGFDGEVLIASGSGVCEITKEGAKPYLNSHEITGTFVILRIKNKKIDNIYDYLKYETINKISED